jgi:hypothetical protein
MRTASVLHIAHIEQMGEQRFYLAMPRSLPRIEFQLLLHSRPQRSLHDRRLFARIGR